MKRYRKLVRDDIPAIIKSHGQVPVTQVLRGQELLDALIAKLDEELQEFKEAKNVEELADIAEVVLALADQIANREELEKARRGKLDERGGFVDGIFLEYVA